MEETAGDKKWGVGEILKCSLEMVYPIFAAYVVITASLPPLQGLALFLSMTLILVFLKTPTFPRDSLGWRKRCSLIIDSLLILLSIVIGIYVFMQYSELIYRVGSPTQWDIILGIIATLLVLEGTRRAGGYTLLIISIFVLLYTYFIDLLMVQPILPFEKTDDESSHRCIKSS